MKSKKQTPVRQKRQMEKPRMPWQTGEYSRIMNYHALLPYEFLLLCKLWDTTPGIVLNDFMDNLAHGSPNREGRDAAKRLLVQYILAMRYGQQQYTEPDIEKMFTELDALGLLYPKDNEKVRDLYVQWRDEHYQYWFDRWYYRYKRKDGSHGDSSGV